MNFRSTLTMAIATASIALTGPALAQDQTEASMEVPEIAAEDVTSGQVASFVNAMIALERIRAEYLPQIQAAETDDERQALATEADEAAKAAVTKTKGITPEEYLAIGRAAQGSEELGQKINARIVELREKQQQKRQPLQQPSASQSEDGAAEGETATE